MSENAESRKRVTESGYVGIGADGNDELEDLDLYEALINPHDQNGQGKNAGRGGPMMMPPMGMGGGGAGAGAGGGMPGGIAGNQMGAGALGGMAGGRVPGGGMPGGGVPGGGMPGGGAGGGGIPGGLAGGGGVGTSAAGLGGGGSGGSGLDLKGAGSGGYGGIDPSNPGGSDYRPGVPKPSPGYEPPGYKAPDPRDTDRPDIRVEPPGRTPLPDRPDIDKPGVPPNDPPKPPPTDMPKPDDIPKPGSPGIDKPNIPTGPGPGDMPGGMPGGTPGGMPGGMPGGAPGGGMPGGGMPGGGMPGAGGPPTAEQLEVAVDALRDEADLWEELADEYKTLAGQMSALSIDTATFGWLNNCSASPGLATAYQNLYNNVSDCLGLGETEFRAIAENLHKNADKYDETEETNEQASDQVTNTTNAGPNTGGRHTYMAV